MEKLPFVLWAVLWPLTCQLCNLLYSHNERIKYGKVEKSEAAKHGDAIDAIMELVAWVSIGIALY